MASEPASENKERSKWNICEIGEKQNDIIKRLEKLEHKENKQEEMTEREWAKKSMDELERRVEEGTL